MIWLLQLIKFGAVGVLGIGVDFSATWLCKEKLKLNKYLSNGIGFSVAVTQNYILNRIWTFQNQNPHIFFQFSKFLGISLVGLLLNMGIVYLLHERLKVPFYMSKLLAIFFVFFWNFSANYYFTF